MSTYVHLPKEILLKLKTTLATIRTGSINSSVLDSIEVYVPSYGMNMKISELATVTVPEPMQLMITPFDKKILPNIEKAISDSNLGVNPNNNGVGIRLIFPPMTEERRKQFCVKIKAFGDESKVEVRMARQKLLNEQKKLKESSEISEDELKRFETNLQKEVDNMNGEIDEIIKNKTVEIMKI